ncbi:MAG: response regulator [Deltaproteobacteria bacterium]|nr:response regulator [Deltaproteobacteria bacterium]
MSSERQTGKKILIAEDDPVSRQVLKKVLKKEGYDVIEADNGQTAWSLFSNERVNILITDWFMPGIDGLELISRVRNLKLDYYVYIIMVTANDDSRSALKVFEAGADDYIAKPYIPEEVIARIRTGCRVIELEDRYKNTRDLEREKMVAQAQNIAKSEFLANMSHEIRTPLNGIIGITELVLDTEKDSKNKEYMKTLLKEAESLLKLVNDILDFSKIESGKLELEKTVFNIKIMMDDIYRLFSTTAQKKGLVFNLFLAPDIPPNLIGDPGRLRQIINNLIGNALKFTHHGSISLKIEVAEKHDELLKLRFEITDTGIGIPYSSQGKILERFSQADCSTSRNYGGSGLGTTISKQLAELMGGELGFASNEGKGSKFWFTADFLVSRGQPVSPHNSSPAFKLTGIKILIASSNSGERLYLAGILRSFGCDVTEVDNCGDLYARLETSAISGNLYNLVLVDFKIDGTDGFGVCAKIRENERLKNTLLILLTSVGKPGDGQLCKDIGINGYLTRPFNKEEFTGVIKLVLTGSNQTDRRLITRYNVAEEDKRTFNILLAEDYPTNQKVAMQHLVKAGYHVDLAEDGKQAVEMFRNKPYDIILMDIQMPGMSGFEATACIRKMEKEKNPSGRDQPGTIIIAMTAHAMQGYREKCIKAGFNDYLSKPIRKSNLLSLISDWIIKITDRQDTDISEEESIIIKKSDNTIMPDDPVNISKMLEEFQGDKAFVFEVIDDFIGDVNDQISTLEKALNKGDSEKIRMEAHAVKGGALNICAEALSNVAYELEQAGRAGHLDNCSALFGTLKNELSRLDKYVRDCR